MTAAANYSDTSAAAASTSSSSSDASATAASKLSLLHILADSGDDDDGDSVKAEQDDVATRSPSKSAPISVRTATGKRRAMTVEEKRKARTCVVDGCGNYIVHRQRCFRHGGGRACSVEGCNTSAKQRGLCWRHGGSILCTIEGCGRGVKSKGLCWTHGRDLSLQLRSAPQSGSSASLEIPTGSLLRPPHHAATAQVSLSFSQQQSPISAPARTCLFDGCWELPVVMNGCHSTGFCRRHVQRVSQHGFVFEL